jgi:hypothetical protein
MTMQSAQLHSTTTYKGKTLPLTLLPDENVLIVWETQGGAEELIATTHRVQVSRRSIGRRWKTNIMLDSITACSLEFRSKVAYIVLAVLAALFGGGAVAADSLTAAAVGIGLAVLFTIKYVRSRGQVVEFTTSGATITVGSSGRSLNEVRRLVETVEGAKNARYIQRFAPASSTDAA